MGKTLALSRRSGSPSLIKASASLSLIGREAIPISQNFPLSPTFGFLSLDWNAVLEPWAITSITWNRFPPPGVRK